MWCWRTKFSSTRINAVQIRVMVSALCFEWLWYCARLCGWGFTSLYFSKTLILLKLVVVIGNGFGCLNGWCVCLSNSIKSVVWFLLLFPVFFCDTFWFGSACFFLRRGTNLVSGRAALLLTSIHNCSRFGLFWASSLAFGMLLSCIIRLSVALMELFDSSRELIIFSDRWLLCFFRSPPGEDQLRVV